jgi:hypothetical protein
LSAYAFPLYVVSHTAVMVWALYLYKVHKAPGSLLVALIAAALLYDNLIVSLGTTIGIGTTLEALSWPRFAMHVLLTPLMLVCVTRMAIAGGIRWADARWWTTIVWVLVVSLMAQGAFGHLIGLETAPACFDGIVRYTANLHPSHFCFEGQVPVNGSGPPIAAIASNILTVIIGFFLWRQHGWGWLMLGALVMFGAAAVPMSIYGMAPGNAGEAILMWAYVATVARFGCFKKSA